MSDQTPPFHVAMLAGSVAGVSVDASLFPLDTVKTRLQSSHGFWKSGGFRGIYSGILPALLGSAPTAAAFFATYEVTKSVGSSFVPQRYDSFVHMFGASMGEVVACLVRVPVEVVKQRAQATRKQSSSILRSLIHAEGLRGLYRGYFITVMRDIPFSFLQFPFWELNKKTWSAYQGRPVDPWQSAICGAISAGVSAAATTPLDVVKTRVMLATQGTDVAIGNVLFVANRIWMEKGVRGLFAGIAPRVLWISIGGSIFLGVYEKAKLTMIQSL